MGVWETSLADWAWPADSCYEDPVPIERTGPIIFP